MEKLKLRLPGVAVTPSGDEGGFGEFAGVAGVEIKLATRLDGTRAAGASREGIPSEADEADVLQLRWDRDVVELVRVGDLEERFGAVARGAGGELAIPTWQAYGSPQRGEAGLRLSAVEHIAVKAVEHLTDAVVPAAIRAIEQQLMPQPGLYELDATGKRGARPIQASSELPGAAPLLVLLHGCFSDTARSFRDLFPSKEWQALYASVVARGGKVLALEHHTVSEGPIHHALELARLLPAGACLHLLSYSQGGLIGDLLVRPRWEEAHAARFFPAEHYLPVVRDELRELNTLLGQVQPKVERFLRVASPAAGTLLASERLDTYLNVILSVLDKLLVAGAPWFAFVKAIATQIVATRTKPEACPGLEAMMPRLDRGLVPFLNAAPRTDTQELAVIGGDVEGGHAFQRIKAFFARLYFQEKSDLVVDTRSMYRGVPRREAWAHLVSGPKAHHFGYFADEDLRGRMLGWLQHRDVSLFRPLAEARARVETRGGAFGFGSFSGGDLKPQAGRDVVVLLPGIMGSHLKVDGHRVWVDFWSLAWGGLRKLGIGSASKITASEVIDGFYEQLARYLHRTWNVEVFPFDWRRSIAESAALLETKLAELHRSGVRVRLIAHSMGGLVSRACIGKNPQLWREIVQRGGRLVMLGTPNFGSYVPARAFTRQHALLRTIERLDVKSDIDQLTRVVRGFPGLLEMLPLLEKKHDLLAFGAWRGFEAYRPGSVDLDRARVFRTWLDTQAILPDSMVYVAGQARETPVAMALRDGKVMFQMSPRGDGTVPWELGLLPNVETYFVDCEHGDLAKHERSFPGYHDLLQNGRTTQLGKAPARSVRAAEADQAERRWVSEEELPEVRYYPSEEELLGSLLGASLQTASAPTIAPIVLEVLNANLQHAAYPVLVGHYLGDPIVSAERALDVYHQGLLGRDHRLGSYPGELNTARVYRRLGSRGATGAIVVGLGSIGQLTRPRLQSTLSSALLEYALSQCTESDAADRNALCVSSLLVGTWATRLSVEDCVTALCDAAREVNAKLAAETVAIPVRIAKIQIVELYRDMAGDAVRATRRLAAASGGTIEAAPTVVEGRDFRRIRPSSPYGTGWQRHISIRATAAGEFNFEHITELARTDEQKRMIQWRHVKPLLEKVGSDADAPATLFHYLLPFSLGEQTKESPDLVLHLDAASAQVPWELLHPHGDGNEPLGVRSGILRTLTVRGALGMRRAPGRSALVIGEPVNVEPALPGALAEARDVAARLEQRGVQVTSLFNRSADEILSALYRDAYDIIHIAAHGEFHEEASNEASPAREASRRPATANAGEPLRSGVVLETGRYLTAEEFENLRAVPSIVFLNCCHLGKLKGGTEDVQPNLPGAWSASVAEQLIQMGVGVVVVAGWAVNDTAARTFANVLYGALLEGQNLMSALRAARKETYGVSPLGDVTWGAYQVYGSPGFVMRHALKTEDAPVRAPMPVSHPELVDYLLDVATRAGRPSSDADSAIALKQELDDLKFGVKDRLDNHGDVQNAFGHAYTCLGDYASALDAYKQAVTCSDAPFEAAEQLADVETRQAERLWFEAGSGDNVDPALRKKAEEAFDSSRERLASLLALAPSAERYALLGANRRRLAKCSVDPARPDAHQSFLIAARDAYGSAVKLKSENDYYHLTVVESLNLCLDPRSVDREKLDKAKERASLRVAHDPFAELAPIDADLVLYAVSAALGDRPAPQEGSSTPPTGGPPPQQLTPQAVELSRQIANRYVEALAASSDSRRRMTVTNHIDTLRQLATHPLVVEWLRQVQEGSNQLLATTIVERPLPRRPSAEERRTARDTARVAEEDPHLS